MLSSKAMPTFVLKDEETQRIQQQQDAVLNSVLATPILDGRLIQGLTVPTSGPLVVPHGMNRRALGIFVVAASAAVSVPYQLPADQTSPTGAIMLRFTSGAGATISVWVF
jgi:hypothetical protein